MVGSLWLGLCLALAVGALFWCGGFRWYVRSGCLGGELCCFLLQDHVSGMGGEDAPRVRSLAEGPGQGPGGTCVRGVMFSRRLQLSTVLRGLELSLCCLSPQAVSFALSCLVLCAGFPGGRPGQGKRPTSFPEKSA